jgi:hypothetical protein
MTRQPLAQQPANSAVVVLRFHLLVRHDFASLPLFYSLGSIS